MLLLGEGFAALRLRATSGFYVTTYAPQDRCRSPRVEAPPSGVHGSNPLQQIVVLRVRPDPEPVDLFLGSQSQSPVADSDTNGVDRLVWADPLELEAGVMRVRAPQSIGTGGLRLNCRRQLVELLLEFLRDARPQSSVAPPGNISWSGVVSPAAISRRAPSARRSHCSVEVLSKRTSQACSSSKSARIRAAKASCVSAGSSSSLAMARCSDCVITSDCTALARPGTGFPPLRRRPGRRRVPPRKELVRAAVREEIDKPDPERGRRSRR